MMNSFTINKCCIIKSKYIIDFVVANIEMKTSFFKILVFIKILMRINYLLNIYYFQVFDLRDLLSLPPSTLHFKQSCLIVAR